MRMPGHSDSKARGGGKSEAVPGAVISRLPRYHRYLGKLLEKNVEKISSRELSGMLGVSASQLRQDLSYFGSFGQKGYGYNVRTLHDAIGGIIGLGRKYDTVIVGAGNLGRALANYQSLGCRGFVIRAIFEQDPEKIGTEIGSIRVRDVREMGEYVARNGIEIGIITVPEDAAQEVAETLVRSGVDGIWNFAPVDIEVYQEVPVENEHLLEGLLTLSFRIKNRRRAE